MERKTLAKRHFYDGLNCAQSVLYSFKEDVNISDSELLKLSAGFGGGMGKLQRTCGAVTGAFMVLALTDKFLIASDQTSRESTNDLIRNFDAEFVKIHKTTQCRELLGVDFLTEDGVKKFEDLNLKKKVCKKCIHDSVTILETLITY